MAKKYDSDIVGWATINGRRVPIRKGEGKRKEVNPISSQRRRMTSGGKVSKAYANKEASEDSRTLRKKEREYDRIDKAVDKAYRKDASDEVQDKLLDRLHEKRTDLNSYQANYDFRKEKRAVRDEKHRKHMEKERVKKRRAEVLKEWLAD